jgi:hypothetical protein
VPVADHEALAVIVALIRGALDVLSDLGLQRRRDHAPCALPSEIIERDLIPIFLPDWEPANI